MKNFIAVVVLLSMILHQTGYSQDIKKLERLDAIKTRGAIYITEFNATSRKYLTDHTAPATEARNFVDKKTNYFRTNNNNVSILMPFYNPLQYSVKVYSSYADDPAVKTYDEFMTAFSKTFELMAPQLEITTPSTAAITSALPTLKINAGQRNNFSYFALGNGRVNAVQPGVRINSILLRDWVYQLVQKPYLREAYSLEFSDAVTVVENFLIGKVTIDGVEKSVDEWIKSKSKELYDQKTIKTFEEKLTEADALLTKLSEIQTDAVTKSTAVVRLLQNQPDAKNANGTDDLLFQNYSKVTARYFETESKPLFDQRREKIAQFETFLQKLRADYNATYSRVTQPFSPLELASVGNIAMQDDKDLKISIGLRKLDANGNKTSDTVGISLTVIHQNRFNIVADVSAGIVFFAGGMEYTSYSLKDDVIVEEVNNKEMQPVVFLNFYSHLYKDFYLMLPQVGVTNATNFPALLLGTGVTALNRFSVSAGIPISFAQKLKDISPGDALEEDKKLGDYLSFKLNKNFPLYISLSYRVGKK